MYCETYKATIMEKTCVLRQQALEENPGAFHKGLGAPSYHQFGGCKGCEKGLKLYAKFKEGELSMASPKDLKMCPKCGETKSLTEFYNNKSTKDGKSYWCKSCQAASVKAGKGTASIKSTASNDVEKKEVPEESTTEQMATGGVLSRDPETKVVGDRRLAFDYIPSTGDQPKVILDFSHHQDLFERVKDSAKEEFRTPEMQIMYWLNNIELTQQNERI